MKAKALGASLAGFACVADMKKAPSFTFSQMLAGGDKIEGNLEEWPGKIYWPKDAKIVLVIAVEHPVEKPEMDWWFGANDPPGNRLMIRIIEEICTWIEKSSGIRTSHMPYHVEGGGPT